MKAAILLAFCVALGTSPLSAQVGPDVGAEEFAERCAVCHGDGAKGDGPLAGFLNFETADLTVLSRENGGEFPFDRVYRIIDGRTEVAAHGPRKMPIWGYEYRLEADELTDPSGRSLRREAFVIGRILSLIRYLESIQDR